MRLGFLVFTLVWIGWYAQAQLSVVNVLAFLSRPADRFPLGLLPDGAADLHPLVRDRRFAVVLESRRLLRLVVPVRRAAGTDEPPRQASSKIPQLKISFGFHQRLTALKYVVFLVLFGISLSALGTAEQAAEVEPFKTAIILRFARAWPFALYAGAMVASSLFVERAFCRYLCPLGAALAIPARLRIFDWLRRYRECGSPASAAATSARCRRSIPKDISIRTNASSACTARCSTTTTSSARS